MCFVSFFPTPVTVNFSLFCRWCTQACARTGKGFLWFWLLHFSLSLAGPAEGGHAPRGSAPLSAACAGWGLDGEERPAAEKREHYVQLRARDMGVRILNTRDRKTVPWSLSAANQWQKLLTGRVSSVTVLIKNVKQQHKISIQYLNINIKI